MAERADVAIKVVVEVRADFGWATALKLRLAGAGYVEEFVRAEIEKMNRREAERP